MLTVIGLILLVAAAILPWPLLGRGVPWRLAALTFPLGFAIGGLLTRFTDFLPLWAELLLWGWLGLSSYGVLLAMGHFWRPRMGERGWRW